MNPRNFFGELKRRNVYKVGAAYLVVAWLLIQVTTQTFPFFDIPDWAIRLVILLLVLGLPVALIIAWAFELTPEGIKRTEDVAPTESISRRTGRALTFAIVVVAAVAGGLFAFRYFGTTEAVPAAAHKSIAVLPFVNLSAERENEYLSDGITEDLSTALTQIKGLRVAARTSSFVFKGQTGDIRKIGEQLNVSAVLEGSVSKAGNKLRIAAQLVSVADGLHLWATTYDREMTDILEIRSDISQRVTDALRLQLGVEEQARLVRKPTENLDAYEFYLLGRHELNKFTEAGFTKSVEHFRNALARDPNFALASAGLAEAFNNLAFWNYLPPKDAFPAAKRATEDALRLDPAAAEARTALAFIQYEYEWRYADAEREFREAVRLNPGSSTARFWFGEFLLVMGRFAEGAAEIEAARQLDPLSVRVSFDRAVNYFFQRQYDRAITQLEKTTTQDPQNSLAFDLLAVVFWKLGRDGEAHHAFQKVHELERSFTSDEMDAMEADFQSGGLRAFALKKAELMEQRRTGGSYQSAYRVAQNKMIGGAREKTFEWLEHAVQERATWLPELNVDPTWDEIRADPRFVALLEKIGFAKQRPAP